MMTQQSDGKMYLSPKDANGTWIETEHKPEFHPYQFSFGNSSKWEMTVDERGNPVAGELTDFISAQNARNKLSLSQETKNVSN